MPGVGRVPANMPPSMTKSAPNASAFTTSPGWRMPPSATTDRSVFAHFSMEESMGTPKPVFTRVEHTEPPPIPTLIMSAPHEAR